MFNFNYFLNQVIAVLKLYLKRDNKIFSFQIAKMSALPNRLWLFSLWLLWLNFQL